MISERRPVRVRFAPSPTGHLHLGGARTALYDFLLARQTHGQFILRIEDTDRKRYVAGAEEEICAGLRWLGLEYDEGPDVGGPCGPYRQSERKAIHQEYAQRLVNEGHAYYCFCSPERLGKVREEQQRQKLNPRYDGTCRKLALSEALRRVNEGEPYTIRFRAPKEGITRTTDLLRGEIAVDNSSLDDIILVKSDGYAVYHLAATVDDHLMQITHVIRGSEWLSTLPVHALIHQAFGWDEPVWAHLSVFLKPSGKGKMSKREAADLAKDGYSIFIKDFEALGYLPEAVNNWIALMGWSYDDRTEFFSMQDLIEKFSLEKLTPSPAAVNFTKLDHFNGLHIRALRPEDLARRIKPYYQREGYITDDDILSRIAPIVQEHIVTLDEVVEKAGFFFKDSVVPVAEDLVAKGLTAQQSAEIARKAYHLLAQFPEMKADVIELPMRKLVEELGLTAGQVFGILRVAVTGQKVSPPLFESMEIVGRERVLARIQQAINLLEAIG